MWVKALAVLSSRHTFTLARTAPQGLIEEDIYKEIAIALHTPPHRAVSLALVAQALALGRHHKDAARLAACLGRGSVNRLSFSSASASSSAGGSGGSAGGDVEVVAI